METSSLIRVSGLTNSSSEHADFARKPVSVGSAHIAAQPSLADCNLPPSEVDIRPGLDTASGIWEACRSVVTKLYQLAWNYRITRHQTVKSRNFGGGWGVSRPENGQ